MKKILFFLLLTSTAYSQAVSDYIEAPGGMTTTIRNSLVVPTNGAMWGWNATTQQLEYAADDQTWLALSGGASDHGALTGLSDDDHTQYHNDARAATWLAAITNVSTYSWVLDEDDMTSDSATKVPTQQSVKAYVDAASGAYTDEAAQDAVGGILTDTGEIDFTYTDGSNTIEADIVAGSIDESKLDTSVNASLDLADTAVQPAAIANFGGLGSLNTWQEINTFQDLIEAEQGIDSGGDIDMQDNDLLDVNGLQITNTSGANQVNVNFVADSNLAWNIAPSGYPAIAFSFTSGAWTYPILDTADNFTADNVETALAELAADIAAGGSVEDVAFDETWDANTAAASKNSLYDYLTGLIENGTGTVNSTNLLDDTILAADMNVTGGLTDEYLWTYESSTGGFELVDFPDLSLSGTGNKDLGITGGTGIDLTDVDGIDPLNIINHASSPVSITSVYVGTTSEISGAGLGTDVLAFPTDGAEAMTLTGTQTVTGDKTFSGSLDIPSATTVAKDPSNSYSELYFNIGAATRILKATGSDLFFEFAGVETRILSALDIPSIEDTPTTVLTLDLPQGRYSNMGSANSATTYTTTGTVVGAWVKVLINASSQPAVTGGDLVAGATFASSTDMFMVVYHNGTDVEYFFLEK